MNAAKLWNVARWAAGRVWDACGQIPSDSVLKSYLKSHERYADLNAQSSQQVIEELAEAFDSWYGHRRNGNERANPPGYRKNGDEHPRATVTFFVDVLDCDVLYRKGPFGDPDSDSMERRLDVHPDARASLAMLRCGPTMNLELFEWDAPDQDETPPKNSDVGGMHLALQLEDLGTAVDAMAGRDDVTILDEPQTNDSGPTEGLRYVYCRVEWGLYLELLETPDRMPYADETDERLYGPAPSWTFRPDSSE